MKAWRACPSRAVSADERTGGVPWLAVTAGRFGQAGTARGSLCRLHSGGERGWEVWAAGAGLGTARGGWQWGVAPGTSGGAACVSLVPVAATRGGGSPN